MNNFFDKNKEFFIIDSDNLDHIQSRLYGYVISEKGVYTQDNFTREIFFQNLTGRGSYTYLDIVGDSIDIYQDFVGSYGLYLYKTNNYFALSNSFLLLVEHLQGKNYVNLDLNIDFINHYLELWLEAKSCEETPIKQITLLDRSAKISICKTTKKINIDSISYNEGKYALNSEEGLKILDDWFNFWTNFIYNIYQKTNRISIDLSGGYDSRLTFLLALCSGINLSNIRVLSINDNLHCHKEDFQIASQIADFYNFKLNKPLPESKFVYCSVEDIFDIESYTKMCFHKEIYPQTRRYFDTSYNIKGVSGEAIRATPRWDKEYRDFVNQFCSSIGQYSCTHAEKLLKANENIFRRDFDYVKEKYSLTNNKTIGHNLLWDTQCRTHGGKISVIDYIYNRIDFVPLMDPVLLQINLNTSDCFDNNLLMLTIYERYCPKLLEFPFEGKRYSIDPQTHSYAKRINKLYKYQQNNKITSDNFNIVLTSGAYNGNQKNESCSDVNIQNFIEKLFFNPNIKSSFINVCDEEFYDKAAQHFNVSNYHPTRYMYGIISLASIFSIVDNKKSIVYDENNSLSLRLKMMLNNAYYTVTQPLSFIDKYKNFITARIDVKFVTDTTSSFLIKNISDDKCNVFKPIWFQTDGIGYVLTSNLGDIEFSCETDRDGQVSIYLRGMDVRSKDNSSERMPHWINFQKFIIDEEIIFDGIDNLVWHDKPYVYKFGIKANQKIRIKLSWLPTFNKI